MDETSQRKITTVLATPTIQCAKCLDQLRFEVKFHPTDSMLNEFILFHDLCPSPCEDYGLSSNPILSRDFMVTF